MTDADTDTDAMPKIDHWDEVVVERIETNYRPSSRGDDYVFCPTCSAHIALETLCNNNAECPGCTHMTNQQKTIRGGL